MKNPFTVCCLLALALPAAALPAESAAAILSRMDQAAPSFQAVSADMRLVTWTNLISDKNEEQGTLVMQRLKNRSVRAILDFSHQKDASANRIIAILGNTVELVYINAKTYQDYDLGAKTQALNQFLLLGFGSSGRELAESYDITAQGLEKIDGQETTKLLLAPKSAGVKDQLSKVEIWIPPSAAYPIQQKFYGPDSTGNYRIATYSGIKLNPPIKGKQLDYKPPKNFKKIK